MVITIGWNSGSDIFETVALDLKKEFGIAHDKAQHNILTNLIEVLEAMDCDVLEEAFGVSEVADRALKDAGYHMYTDECEWNTDYTKCFCGFVER